LGGGLNMAKLYYWIAEADHDKCYSVVGKTKKEVLSKFEELGYCATDYDPPVRRVIEYRDAFDLFDLTTGEGGGRTVGSLAR